MKIGIDCRLHHYNRTGIGRYIRNLVRELPECDIDGADLVLFQSRREQEALIQGPAVHCRKVVTPPHHQWERWLLAAEIAPKRVDLLHSPDHVAPNRLGWESVVTVQDLSFLAHPEVFSSASILYYTQVFRTLSHAARVVTVSDFTRNEVLNRTSIDPERVTTIHMAADPAYFPRSDTACASVRSRLDTPDSFILVVGTIEARKNLERVVEAYALLPRKDRPHLVFAGGRGYQYDRVIETVQKHRLEDQVKFLGLLSDEELPMLYSSAVCLLFPSRYEGFGLPILEAMACGCPVITSNFGSMAEVAGDAGILVDPNSAEAIADGITSLLADSALRDRMVVQGHARVKQFSWRTAAQQTLAVYREAVGAH